MSCSRCNRRVLQDAIKRLESQTPKGSPQSSSTVSRNVVIDLSVTDSGFEELNYAAPAIKNSQWRPPNGGWGVTLMVKGQKILYNGTPSQMVQRIVSDYKSVAGVDVPAMKVWNYLNDVWRKRDPMRAFVPKPAPELKPITNDHMNNSVELAGPYLWTMLSSFGRKGMFDSEAFVGAVNYLVRLFSGDQVLRCEECLELLTKYRIDRDPKAVSNEGEAAKWVFDFHNQVNTLLGKPQLDFEEAIVQNRWDISITKSES